MLKFSAFKIENYIIQLGGYEHFDTLSISEAGLGGIGGLRRSDPALITESIQLSKKEDFSAIIFCNGKNNKKLVIFFYESKPQEPYSNSSDLQTDQGVLYVHIHQYPFYLDLLRNESPVFAYLYEEPEKNKVTTKKPEKETLHPSLVPHGMDRKY